LRLGLPKAKPEEAGLATIGISDFISDALPKLNENGLEFCLSSSWLLSSAACFPSRKGRKDPGPGPELLAAKTVSRGFLGVSLEEGVVVRRNELEERVGAMKLDEKRERKTGSRGHCVF